MAARRQPTATAREGECRAAAMADGPLNNIRRIVVSTPGLAAEAA
jgi:hypothetical protein